MKKLILSFAMVMLVSTMALGQMSNSEIYRIISQSKELNKNVTLNPDSILPGQRLSFLFTDGYVRYWVVAKGETETSIVRQISELEKIHGRVVAPKDTTAVDPAVVKPKPVAPVNNKEDFPYWTLFGIFLIILFLYFLLRFLTKSKKETKTTEQKYVDPTKEGAPFMYGGVKAENAESHFHTLARMNNTEESNIVIKNIRPVFISTRDGVAQEVSFLNGSVKNLLFRNVPGFAGLVSRDKGKTFAEEYFFQACGNPVRNDTSFDGKGLIISDTPIKFGGEEIVVEEVKTSVSEEAKAPEVAEEKPVVEEPIVKDLVPEIPVKVKNSNLLDVSVDHVLMVERLLEVSPNIHRVSTKFVNSEGSVETIFETKNVPTEKAKKEGEK